MTRIEEIEERANNKDVRPSDMPWSVWTGKAIEDREDLLQFIKEALLVMEWAAGIACIVTAGFPPDRICGYCSTCQARAWLKKHGKES